MSAILSGSLKAFSAEAILQFLTSSKATGTLRVSARAVELVFRSGGIVFARTTRQSATATPQPAVISRRDLELAVIDILQAGEATFEFDDVAAAPDEALPVALDFAALKQEATATDQRRREAHELFANREAVAYVVSTPDTSQISLDPEEFKLLFRIGSAKLVRDVVRESELDARVVYDQLYSLLEQRLIDVRLQEREAEPSPEPAPESSGIGCLTLEDEARTSFPLFDDLYTIGRDASNSIRIKDGSVSSLHARVVRAPGGYAIEDAGSRNGTYVNGRKIERELLKNNDSIRLGKVYLVFNTADQDLNQTVERVVSPDL